MAKILLVEDNEFNRDMLSRRLKRRGHEVLIAVDGLEGINLALSAMPDLILMDMSLPEIDGWEATRRLKADAVTAGIPIIALTAHAMVGDRDRALAAGCDEYDTKPVELPRLLGKMQQLLEADRPAPAVESTVKSFPSNAVITDDRQDALTPAAIVQDRAQPDSIQPASPKLDSFTDSTKPNGQATVVDNPAVMTPPIQVEIAAATQTESSQTELTTAATQTEPSQIDSTQTEPTTSATQTESSQTELTIAKSIEPLEHSAATTGPSTLLVVDDNENNRDMLGRRLERQGYQVILADSGEVALATLKAEPSIDLVLLDIMMPGMDGLETLSHIRQMYESHELPVIMATAKSQMEDMVQAFKGGANDYITKPIDFPAAQVRIKTQLQQMQAMRQPQIQVMEAVSQPIASPPLMPTPVANASVAPAAAPSVEVSVNSAETAALPALSTSTNPTLFFQDRYRLIRQLAEDSLGCTMLVEDQQTLTPTKRIVEWIKFSALLQQDSQRRDLRTNLTAEKARLEAIRQAGYAVPLQEIAELNGDVYLTNMWFQGQSLQEQMLSRPPAKSAVECLRFIETLLRLLIPLHQHQVIHGNLQPQHIFQMPNTQVFILTNWGSRQRLLTGLLPDLWEQIPLSDRPYYAPELKQDNLCLASDIYSVGILGLEALTGKSASQLPMDANGHVFWEGLLGAYPAVADVFERLLSPDLEKRFSSIAEAKNEILASWYKLQQLQPA
ncbi:response regulator [filamentous cyanobacterium LEGE 11480]|uniref:Response regulator n=1 Tax=Romeriopsis navalis LEGE 11480 TaxID=2777977 RepID=A0A928VLB9_9CYAN|nr:response regulator [Romeriopsis navalis]MBE9028736.1 response regulator [Romeriopsis navalis LEGE 11480]